jgi:hypothetical protein
MDADRAVLLSAESARLGSVAVGGVSGIPLDATVTRVPEKQLVAQGSGPGLGFAEAADHDHDHGSGDRGLVLEESEERG